ncbi:hypothetical protein H0H81_002617 [Sphagnurus paluster]|uniref:Uncharacterized protein n=1 Tax=Sphagnurus paluster TaxID=117069 RepID=A0A9P7GQI9_9AGAR|nr:hypothetical protein H0H81_002617 [Sphagnurus paluster]
MPTPASTPPSSFRGFINIPSNGSQASVYPLFTVPSQAPHLQRRSTPQTQSPVNLHPPPHPNGSQVHPEKPRQNQNPPPRASGAILTGAERFLQLFEEEQAKIETRHKEEVLALETRFQKFREFAAQGHNILTARLKELESELVKTREMAGSAAVEGNVETGPTADPSTPRNRFETTPANTIFRSGVSPTLPLDDATAQLLAQFSEHFKAAVTKEIAEPSANVTANPGQPVTIPDALIPALAQYLASHRNILKVAEEKVRAGEKERDSLRKQFKEKLEKKRSTIRCLKARIQQYQSSGCFPGVAKENGTTTLSDADSDAGLDTTDLAVAWDPAKLSVKRSAEEDASALNGKQ